MPKTTSRPSCFTPRKTPKELREERAKLIAKLGWDPEDGTAAGRYVATSAEMEEILAEQGAA